MIHVYGLVESGKQVGQIRYIGITTDPDQRLHQHRTTKEDTDKGRWIADLRRSGKNIDMVILDSAATRDDAHIKENAWIIFARSRKWELTNGTNPGEHRSMLEGEISSIEGVVEVANKLMAENEAVKSNMEDAINLERTASENKQKMIDDHFRKWYQSSVALALICLSFAMSAYLVNGLMYDEVAEEVGAFHDGLMLFSAAVVYPCIAFCLWFFLKDVPIYRPHVGSESWKNALDSYQMSSYDAIKRVAWHAGVMVLVLGIIAACGN